MSTPSANSSCKKPPQAAKATSTTSDCARTLSSGTLGSSAGVKRKAVVEEADASSSDDDDEDKIETPAVRLKPNTTASLSSSAASPSLSIASSSSSSPTVATKGDTAPMSGAIVIPANSISLRFLPDFLTPDECRHLISLAEDTGYARSTVGLSRPTAYVSASRTSFGACLPKYDSVVTSVLRRVTKLTSKPVECIEGPDVVRYRPGQHFKEHFDSSEGRSRPRQYTVFVYLNDVDGGGGETHFPRLGLKVKPKRGAALFWENHSSETSAPHADSRHAGLPLTSGTKYGLNMWVCFRPHGDSDEEESDEY